MSEFNFDSYKHLLYDDLPESDEEDYDYSPGSDVDEEISYRGTILDTPPSAYLKSYNKKYFGKPSSQKTQQELDLGLIVACENGDVGNIIRSLKAGANINARNGDPLLSAINEYQLEAVVCLLMLGRTTNLPRINVHAQNDLAFEITRRKDLHLIEILLRCV